MRKSRKSPSKTMRLLPREPTRKVKPYKVRAKNLGLRPGYSFDKPWELIEEIEGAHYR
jgi:hypothetical protein